MGYVDSQHGAHARTAFRNAEKQYKRYKEASTRLRSSGSRNRIQPTDVSQVLDFRKYVDVIRDTSTRVDGVTLAGECLNGKPAFVIEGRPGFHFIPHALTVEEQYYWIKESLVSFTQPPNRTNHNAEYGPIRDLWTAARDDSVLVEVTPKEEEWSVVQNSRNPRPLAAHTSADEHTESGERDNKFREHRIQRQNISANEEDNKQHDERSYVEEGNSFPSHNSSNPVRPGSRTARLTNEKTEESSKHSRFDWSRSNGEKCSKSVKAESLLRRLRWATIGMQFDWSKKAYNTSLAHDKLPQRLAELAARLAEPAVGGREFQAEAAIVNYYGPDDMLGGHVDDMEADWSKPIVSISFGCKAIFLLGGETRDEPPIAMFLRSGDVVLMSGPARRCFHGVPRIFIEDDNADLPDISMLEKDPAKPISRYIREARININVRQVN